jgi:hypothetical protein
VSPSFEDLRQGDLVKVRVNNERLWFEVLAHVAGEGRSNAVLARLSSKPVEGVVFDGRVTLDRAWIIETHRRESDRPKLSVVA